MNPICSDKHDIRKGTELYFKLFPKATSVPIKSSLNSSRFKLNPQATLQVTSLDGGVYYQFINNRGDLGEIIFNPNLVIVKFKKRNYA